MHVFSNGVYYASVRNVRQRFFARSISGEAPGIQADFVRFTKVLLGGGLGGVEEDCLRRGTSLPSSNRTQTRSNGSAGQFEGRSRALSQKLR